MKIEVKNLTRSYGKTKAVNNISFNFESGSVYGFIGPNGAGKTTTIKIMSTIDTPCSGDVLFDGVSAVEYPEKVRFFLGYMPDTLPENADVVVWEYLDFFARAYGLRGAQRTRVLRQIEEFTSLGELREKRLNALSKGMKQRVCLARALVHDPHVLIMDEPAAGLDPRARLELRELVKVLAKQGKAILISSHILSELEDMCDGAIIIEKGRLLSAGSLNDIGKQHQRDNMTVSIRFLGNAQDTLKKILQIPLVENARLSGDNQIIAELAGHDDECSSMICNMVQSGCRIVEFRQQELGLEELFMKITQGEVQ
jgi:ABC-2 type transport system ATP-binding protein